MFEYLMLGDVRARKYSKTGTHTRSILKKFAFDTTLLVTEYSIFGIKLDFGKLLLMTGFFFYICKLDSGISKLVFGIRFV